jgi:hypothetical protein
MQSPVLLKLLLLNPDNLLLLNGENQPKRLSMSKIILILILFLSLGIPFICGNNLRADEVNVQKVELIRQENGWAADVWISHNDEGLRHFANWIEVRYDNGIEGGSRLVRRDILQPSKDNRTRCFYRIYLPELPEIATCLVFRAHCSVHSLGGEVVEVLLKNKSGERYSIRREKNDIYKYASRSLESEYFRNPTLRKKLISTR